MSNRTGWVIRPPTAAITGQVIDARGITLRFDSKPTAISTDFSLQQHQHQIMVLLGHHGFTKEVEFGRLSGRITSTTGDVWVIPAEHPAAARARGIAESCTLSVPTSVLDNRDVTPRLPHRDPLLHQMVVRMRGVAGRDDVFARLFLESLSESLRLHVKDRYGRLAQRPKPNEAFDPLTRVVVAEFLEDNLDDAIRLSTLAALVGMTVRDFCGAFTATFGVPPHQYLLGRRIERGKHLLATTTLTITDIGTAVGFSTPSHFSSAFRKRTGVSPRDYRGYV
jgi:AraC family transcriptional regulator